MWFMFVIIGTLLYTLSMFVLFKTVCSDWHPSGKIKLLLTSLSSRTFGIYLCPPFFPERLQPDFTVTPPLGPLGHCLGNPPGLSSGHDHLRSDPPDPNCQKNHRITAQIQRKGSAALPFHCFTVYP